MSLSISWLSTPDVSSRRVGQISDCGCGQESCPRVTGRQASVSAVFPAFPKRARYMRLVADKPMQRLDRLLLQPGHDLPSARQHCRPAPARHRMACKHSRGSKGAGSSRKDGEFSHGPPAPPPALGSIRRSSSARTWWRCTTPLPPGSSMTGLSMRRLRLPPERPSAPSEGYDCQGCSCGGPWMGAPRIGGTEEGGICHRWRWGQWKLHQWRSRQWRSHRWGRHQRGVNDGGLIDAGAIDGGAVDGNAINASVIDGRCRPADAPEPGCACQGNSQTHDTL